LALNEKLETQKKEIEELAKKFNTEFENIANKILEEKNTEIYYPKPEQPGANS
jgi:DNA recombination protein RmuC